MVLIVLRGLNGQNNEGWSLFDKGSTNREKMAGRGQTTNKRVSEQHYNLAWIFVIKHYSYFCGCWWTININKSKM